MRIYIFLILMVSFCYSQQYNFTSGVKTPSGAAWGNGGITFIDTTTGTTNNIIVDLADYYPYDVNPMYDSTSSEVTSSSRMYIGTFYSYWDNQGTGQSATDSLKYTIKVYPGIYTTENKSVAGIKYGSAITLETISRVADYYSINSVYIHATKYKVHPPEVVKIELAPSGSANCDDSTKVNWRYVYPQLIQQEAYRIDTAD